MARKKTKRKVKRKVKRAKRSVRTKTKKHHYGGMRALGEKDILVGIMILILGSLLIVWTDFSPTPTRTFGYVLIIVGLILLGFGFSDYLRD